MRSAVCNCVGLPNVIAGLARSATAVGGAAAGRRVAMLAAITTALGALASSGTSIMDMEPSELTARVSRIIGAPADPADVDVVRVALAVAAAAEHDDDSAAAQIGRAWASPLLGPVDGDLNVTATALRLASAAHDPAEKSPGEPCCLMCALGLAEEDNAPDPLAASPAVAAEAPRLATSCRSGVCLVGV